MQPQYIAGAAPLPQQQPAPQPQYIAGAVPLQQQPGYGYPQQQQQQQGFYYMQQPQGAPYGGPQPPVPYAAAVYVGGPQPQQQHVYGAQQVAPIGYGGGGGGGGGGENFAVVNGGGVSVYGIILAGAIPTPEQQELINQASWHDEANWFACHTHYWGRFDSRFLVPSRRGCGHTVNRAHPTYRRVVVGIIIAVIIIQVLRVVLAR
jgi:hypothetical protein